MKNNILLFFIIFLGSSKGFAEKQNADELLNQQQLEARVWNAEDSELSSLEKKIITELQKTPKSSFVHYLLSHLYVRFFIKSPSELSFFNQALELADQALHLEEHDEFGYIAKINVLDITEKNSEAQSLLEKAFYATKNENNWRLNFLKIRLSSDKRSVLETFNDLIALSKEKDANKEMIIPFIIDLIYQHFEESKQHEYLLKISKEIPHPLVDQVLAEFLTIQGDYVSAHLLYQKIHIKNPDYKEAKINDAELLLYLHQPQEAIILLQTIKLGKNSSLQAKLDLQFGLSFLALKKFTEAKKYFLDTIKTTQKLHYDLRKIISQYEAKHHYKELVDLLTEITKKMTWFSELYAETADVLWRNLHKYNDAREFYEKAIELEPQRGDYHQTLGLIFYFQKNYSAALLSFDNSLLLDPSNPFTLYNKACILALLNRIEDSLFCLKEAFALDETLKDKALKEPDLHSLQSRPQFIALLQQNEI